MAGVFENLTKEITTAVTAIVIVEGAPAAYDKVGFIVNVKQITGTWRVDFQLDLEGRVFVLASVNVSTQGVVLASRVSALLGKELPIPRPTSIAVSPVLAGQITLSTAFVGT